MIPVRPISSHFYQAVVTELEATIQGSASDVNLDGYHSDVADLADFSDEDVETWDEEDTCVKKQPVNSVVIDSRSRLSDSSANDDGSDVADMDDFPNEEVDSWNDEEPEVVEQPTLQSDLNVEDTHNLHSYEYAILYKIPPIAVLPDPVDEQSSKSWREFDAMTDKAELLDDIELCDSDFPECVKAFIFRIRWIILINKERAELFDKEWNEGNEEESEPLQDDYYQHKLQEYWTYHDEISNLSDIKENEPEPDTRATVNVVQTTAVKDYDDSDGNSSEELVLSAITHESDTPECILMKIIVPDCMMISVLSSSGNFDVCQPDTGRVGVAYCLGLCGSSDDIPDLLCARCIDILLWGFRVSCVISVMTTWTLIKTREFFKRLDVFDGVWGLTSDLITPGDDVVRCLWGTTADEVIGPYVMIGRGAMITCNGFPWRWDIGRFRAPSTPPMPVGSILSHSDEDVPLHTDRDDRHTVRGRELLDNPPGSIEAPQQIPDVAPIPVDRVISVSISEACPLLPEGVTRTLICKPIPKMTMKNDQPYGLQSRDHPHEVQEAQDPPVEEWEFEVPHNKPPVGYTASDTMVGDGPVVDPQAVARPVLVKLKAPRLVRNQEKLPLKAMGSECVSRLGPIANQESVTVTTALTPEAARSDVPLFARRVVAQEGPAPTTDRGPDVETASKTQTPPRKVSSQVIRQLHRPPPPSEVPDWSDGEGTPLLIVANLSVPSTPQQNVDGILVSSADVVSASPSLSSSGEPGTLSAPLSPNRVRNGHSQDISAEGSTFDVSPDIPGFHVRPAGGGVQQSMNTLPPPKLQIFGHFVTSLHRVSSAMLSVGVNQEAFPVAEVNRVSVMPRAQRAARYMTAMGLWRPPSGPVIPGPLPVTSCTSCMNYESCFGRRGPTAQ